MNHHEGEVLRVANCSGFFGDRLSAAAEMVEGGPLDVLTGDWLAELTMGVLAKQRRRDPASGYAPTFLRQMEQVLGPCLDRGIKIVSNAGGLNPTGCATAVEQLAGRLGLSVRVACVTGDEVTERFQELRRDGWPASHLDTGEPFGSLEPEVVNAYLGCWGIAEALEAGADVVVTGRVSDASLIVGPAAWRFGWSRGAWDALAGAVAAGHVIECGAQATGGNYAFFEELSGAERCGFPLAEIAPDGSAVIAKHPGTGGAVTVETVTAQLLYEIEGPRYLNPDVVARFDTLALEQAGPDRVRMTGARGEPAPTRLKVGAVCTAGWRNQVTFVLTGLDVEAKAELAERALWAGIPGGRGAYEDVDVRLLRADRPDPARRDDAVALLRIAASTRERGLARLLSRAAVETGLASYPGLYLTEPPDPGSEYAVFWPSLMPADDVRQRVMLDGRSWLLGPSPATGDLSSPGDPPARPPATFPGGRTVRAPLGEVVGARSGDKAGNATLGVWARDDEAYAWLRGWLTEDRLRASLPEAAGCPLRRYELPNLRAVGFTIVGLLGRGVGANLALDAQAKGLGEYLRARHAEIPAALLDSTAR
ncbi:MAG: acyclic terpene utilization AtuA family protein [Streptosporangiaceae bacterium]